MTLKDQLGRALATGVVSLAASGGFAVAAYHGTRLIQEHAMEPLRDGARVSALVVSSSGYSGVGSSLVDKFSQARSFSEEGKRNVAYGFSAAIGGIFLGSFIQTSMNDDHKPNPFRY